MMGGSRWLAFLFSVLPTKYRHWMKKDVSPSEAQFCDVYGLCDKLLTMVPQLILTVLFIYPAYFLFLLFSADPVHVVSSTEWLSHVSIFTSHHIIDGLIVG